MAEVDGVVDFGDSKRGVSFLRLRTVSRRHYFALKQPDENEQACLEYETEVTDREAMHHAAMLMGYRPTVRIAKTRRTATLDGIMLCVDDVDGAQVESLNASVGGGELVGDRED